MRQVSGMSDCCGVPLKFAARAELNGWGTRIMTVAVSDRDRNIPIAPRAAEQIGEAQSAVFALMILREWILLIFDRQVPDI